MTTRDSRLRPPHGPGSVREGSRERTQSLQLEIDDADREPSNPSLALGTHDAAEERTKVESPGARTKTPAPSRPPPVPRLEDGEIRLGAVLGSYKLVELLGKGGMGYVYRAEHTKLGREVALKLLRSDYAKRRDAVLRFFQEAKTVNKVRHRNIVDVTDFVEIDDGTTFIIMELLRGQSLGRWSRTGIDLPRALAVLVQICDGLGAAHAVGVVHRDLKPDNVIVVPTSDGAELVKLLDFGVAKLVNREDEDVGFQTAAGSVIGTPAYMSPEQAGGMLVDHRSDIYSLGAIMYELFCGEPLFRGRSFGEFVRKHLTEMPIPPRQTQAGAAMDERLEALILRALAKDPNERFSNIIELRDGLLHMLGGIETQPPGIMTLSSSALRPVTSLPPQGLPLQPPQMVTTVPTPPQQMSTMHPSYPRAASYQSAPQFSLQSSQHVSLAYGYTPPPPEVAPPTPIWVWLVGGACAVGLGVIAAVWYANRGTPATPAPKPAEVTTPAPSTTPIEPPVQKPRIVELRFDSLPSAGVFAAGHATELCHTPCTYNVDLRDGGPTDRRTFVVRAEHYLDKTIDVELGGTRHDFSVTLQHEPVAVEPDPTPDKQPTQTEPKHGGSKIVRRRETTRDKKPDKQPDAVTKTPDVTPDKQPDKQPDRQPDKTSGKQPDKQPDTIDPTDTLDPFHRKR